MTDARATTPTTTYRESPAWARDAARRVMARCDALARVSARPDGIERVHLSPEHARANDLVANWMCDAGMRSWQDTAGNQRGRVDPVPASTPAQLRPPALLLGSHIDTVVDAGRYDGMLGVLMAVEVAAALREDVGRLPFALEVVAFSDEEGTRFGKALLGSSALAGLWDDAWWDLADADGVTLREAFVRFGLDPARVQEAAHRPGELVGYLEAHIEQGPLLEADDRPLGVVTSIAGARRFVVEVVGEARHAGGTPYPMRRDALLGAAEITVAVERVCRAGGQIGTVGRLATWPGAVNVVPGRAELTVDLRAADDAARDAAWDDICAVADEVADRRGLTWTATEVHRAPSVLCAPRLRTALADGILATGEPDAPELFSRAGHDAMAVAALTDVGMLFLRNPGGVSHAPDESVAIEDVAQGLVALVSTVRALGGL
ncbi:allantoate amidohydrolase [Luteimicrobium subarcticum]|uniref:Allantoate deiminase n=1 Tax=Luteimicrobium subarcticum TaxID=620910 RepID=A0A2M8WUT1_9MICO|nr:allantoate amidohydrolase [Luteimicrobium subarcticum]PJI94626.1 allantoate deiminase [Luteimicrobium subarcticum]